MSLEKYNYILLDVDGVLADNSHRLHYLKEKNYDKFYDGVEVSNDKKIMESITLIDKLTCHDNSWDKSFVILTTGRPERLRELTSQWISKYWPCLKTIPVLDSFRRDDDHRKSPIVKAEMAEEIVRMVKKGVQVNLYDKLTKIDQVTIIDDDPQNVAAMANALIGKVPLISCITFGTNRLNDSVQSTSSATKLDTGTSYQKSRRFAFHGLRNHRH